MGENIWGQRNVACQKIDAQAERLFLKGGGGKKGKKKNLLYASGFFFPHSKQCFGEKGGSLIVYVLLTYYLSRLFEKLYRPLHKGNGAGIAGFLNCCEANLSEISPRFVHSCWI